MVHGSPVTLSEMNGLGVSTHWRGRWVKGFGKTVLDPSVIAGNWTHFVVNTNADSGSRSLRDALSSPGRWITFDSALEESTIALLSDIPFRENTFIDGTGVRITVTGSFELFPSSSYLLWTSGNPDRGRHGSHNIIYNNGGLGDSYAMSGGYVGTGRAFWAFLFNEFHGSNALLDDTIDNSGRPSLGHYVTQVGNWYGPLTGTHPDDSWVHCTVLGNNRDDQNNHHMRFTWIRNAFYGAGTDSGDARINFRTPIMADAHMDSIECYRELGNRQVQVRNNTTAALRRVIFRSRHEVWDSLKAGSGPHIELMAGASPYVRAENKHEVDGNTNLATGTLDIPESDRNLVTDAAIYVDESGTPTPEYNDYTPGTDFNGMTNVQIRDYIKYFSRWTDRMTVTGSLDGSLGGSIGAKSVILTNTIDDWPTLVGEEKVDFFNASYGGSGWSDVKTQVHAAMLADIVDGGDTNIITTSGKVMTITLPAEANNATFISNEEIHFVAPGDLTTRSGRIETDTVVTVFANEGAPPAPSGNSSVSNLTAFEHLVRW